MSWHGSLTCSYCYERGHTRRKCPEMKERHDRYAQHVKNGTENEASWTDKRAFEEYKQQQRSLDEKSKACAFCGEHGHRVGTCPKRMERVEQLKELDEWFIPIALEVLSDLRYGVGTVIQQSGYIASEYKNNIPHMVTGWVQTADKSNLSIINLWQDNWMRPTTTNMVTMQQSNTRLPEQFRHQLMHKLFEKMGLPEGYDFTERSYRNPNSDYIRENPMANYIGWLPFREPSYSIDEIVVSAMSKPFECTASLGWDYSKKREVNRLFRDSKNSLVEEAHANRVDVLHRALKKAGVL